MSDGNNFGVGIQEQIVGMLQSGRLSGQHVLDTTIRYYSLRGKLVSKIVKYPQIADYRRSVCELDEKEWMMLRHCCLDLRYEARCLKQNEPPRANSARRAIVPQPLATLA